VSGYAYHICHNRYINGTYSWDYPGGFLVIFPLLLYLIIWGNCTARFANTILYTAPMESFRNAATNFDCVYSHTFYAQESNFDLPCKMCQLPHPTHLNEPGLASPFSHFEFLYALLTFLLDTINKYCGSVWYPVYSNLHLLHLKELVKTCVTITVWVCCNFIQ
jgi:hypothetical protein